MPAKAKKLSYSMEAWLYRTKVYGTVQIFDHKPADDGDYGFLTDLCYTTFVEKLKLKMKKGEIKHGTITFNF